jgi:Uma2 family endonuclease
MTAAGAFSDFGGKFELVEGVIVRLSPAKSLHFSVQRQLFLKLHVLFGEEHAEFYVGQEPSFQLNEWTVRDPDVAILRRPDPKLDDWIPGDHLLLAANVSDTTLNEDKGPKRLSYARGGVPHYWVVDIRGRVVEIWSDPADGDYRQHRTIPFGQPIPVPATNEAITLS